MAEPSWRKREQISAMEKGKRHHARFSCGERETSTGDSERELEGLLGIQKWSLRIEGLLGIQKGSLRVLERGFWVLLDGRVFRTVVSVLIRTSLRTI